MNTPRGEKRFGLTIWVVIAALLFGLGYVAVHTHHLVRNARATGLVEAGMARFENKDYAGAERSFRAAVSVYPLAAGARYWLGASLHKLGRRSEALQEFELYITESNKPEESRWVVAEFLLSDGDMAAAMPKIEALVREHPESDRYRNTLERARKSE